MRFACAHNGTIPDISKPLFLRQWRELEFAKHRLFYTILRWKLPLKTRAEDPAHGLVFEFLADPPQAAKVMTGHDKGVITLSLTEADAGCAERESTAQQWANLTAVCSAISATRSATTIGLLIEPTVKPKACRTVFGDDPQRLRGRPEKSL